MGKKFFGRKETELAIQTLRQLKTVFHDTESAEKYFNRLNEEYEISWGSFQEITKELKA